MNNARAQTNAPLLRFANSPAIHQRALLWGGIYGGSELRIRSNFLTMYPESFPETVELPTTTWDVPLTAEDSNASKLGEQATASANEDPQVHTTTAAKSGKFNILFHTVRNS